MVVVGNLSRTIRRADKTAYSLNRALNDLPPL